MGVTPIVHAVLAPLLAPLLLGVIGRTKALFAGRTGPPILQPYHDVAKLLRKGFVISRTTSWGLAAGPVVGLAAMLGAVILTPFAGGRALVSFDGDLIAFIYLLALARLVTILAALDVGSSFEGLGASREGFFSALAEPGLLLALATIARITGHTSLSAMTEAVTPGTWVATGPALALVLVALFIVLLAETARIPFDDPATHLELTMIHEAMILDHGGPDLGLIHLASTLKLWIFGAIVVSVAVPVRTGNALLDGGAFLGGLVVLAGIIGIVESSLARLRLSAVPQLLVGAMALSAVALVLVLR